MSEIKLFNCSNCGTEGVLPMQGMLCPNCKKPLGNNSVSIKNAVDMPNSSTLNESSKAENNDLNPIIIIGFVLGLTGVVMLLSWMAIYGIVLLVENHTFSNHYHYEDERAGYSEGQIAFPGERIGISLAQTTIEGRYKVGRANIIVDGKRALDIEHMGDGQGVWDNSKEIFYEDTPTMHGNVGIISFVLPDNEDILNKEVNVKYDVDFFYPNIIQGTNTFEWKSRRVQGDLIVRVGNYKDYRIASLLRGATRHVPVFLGLAFAMWIVWRLLITKIRRIRETEKIRKE